MNKVLNVLIEREWNVSVRVVVILHKHGLTESSFFSLQLHYYYKLKSNYSQFIYHFLINKRY